MIEAVNGNTAETTPQQHGLVVAEPYCPGLLLDGRSLLAYNLLTLLGNGRRLWLNSRNIKHLPYLLH